jgi:alkanesulfonate monooxygenase SsuD/methylene tetrahydromethanopterin reductase-like flavin-dependent oxidoreductase (luciferase family)
MRIDIILEAHLSADELVDLGTLAEQNGIGAVWLPNKLDGRDPFTNFALLAKATSKIRMGPIAVSPFELHPLKMAAALLTLNEIADGRAQIVVGAGGGTVEAMGLKPENRLTAVTECFDILRKAAKGERFSYDGEVYKVRNFEPIWVKSPPPRLYWGANKQGAFRNAARLADGLMMSDFPEPLIGKYVAYAHDELAKQGKTVSDFPINNFFAWHVYADKEAAHREARRWLVLRGMLAPLYLKPFLSPEDCDVVTSNMGAFFRAYRQGTHIIEGVPDHIVDTLVDNLTLWGGLEDVDRIVDELKRFEKEGLTEIALRLYEDPAQSIRLIGERVVPALS